MAAKWGYFGLPRSFKVLPDSLMARAEELLADSLPDEQKNVHLNKFFPF
jgi:hypothetical protein